MGCCPHVVSFGCVPGGEGCPHVDFGCIPGEREIVVMLLTLVVSQEGGVSVVVMLLNLVVSQEQVCCCDVSDFGCVLVGGRLLSCC